MSGRKGKPLQRLAIPSHEPILHAPQILTDIDGNDVVLFITGDLSHSGGIYIIPISDLLKGDQNGVRVGSNPRALSRYFFQTKNLYSVVPDQEHPPSQDRHTGRSCIG